MTTRREFLIALGIGTVAAPIGAQPQGKVRRIGFLWEIENPRRALNTDAFNAGMRELGYIEGRDYVIEHRSARSDLARLPALAMELLVLKVDMIVSASTPSAMAARNATNEIPILIVSVGDPVGSGLAASLRRPGGNVTGLTNLSGDLTTKHLDLLRQIVPGMRRVGYVYNPDNAVNLVHLRRLESDCKKLQFKLIPVPVRKAGDVATASNTLQSEQAQGLIVSAANTNNALRESIFALATKHQLPAIYGTDIMAASGGLISYSSNARDQYRRAAAYADKIFKGAKPGELPIEQPNKYELVVNLKVAKALGVTIPQSILVSADKVIE